MDLKYYALVLIIIAFLLLVYAATKKYSNEKEPKGSVDKGSLAVIAAIICISAATAMGVKTRKDDGLKTSDYIQIGVVVFAIISILMTYKCNQEFFGGRLVASVVALLACAQLNNY